GGDQQAPARRTVEPAQLHPLRGAAGRGGLLAPADKSEAQLLLDADRAAVGRHGGGLDPGETELLKSILDQDLGCLGGEAQAPIGPADPIAQSGGMAARGQIELDAAEKEPVLPALDGGDELVP